MKLIKLMALATLLLSLNGLRAEELAPAVKVGDKAPGFTLKSEKGDSVSLSDYKGQDLVLVFSRAHW